MLRPSSPSDGGTTSYTRRTRSTAALPEHHATSAQAFSGSTAPSEPTERRLQTSRSKAAPTKPLVARLSRVLCAGYIYIALVYTFWRMVAQPAISLLRPEASASLTSFDELVAFSPARTDLDSGDQQEVVRNGARTASSKQKKSKNSDKSSSKKALTGLDESEGLDLRSVSWEEYGRVQGVRWDQNTVEWSMENDDESTSYSMAEDFFLSKAFSGSLQPTKVIPYYYRASEITRQRDITITTLVTSNRFQILAALADKYQGPISVTIHVSNDPTTRTELLDSLHTLYTSSPSMSMYVDVHLVVDNFDRQFNMWRNVARYFARTEHIMMLDVDFAICTDFRERMLKDEAIMAKLDGGRAAFVLPAFEYTEQKDGLDSTTFPTNKEDLLRLVDEGKIGMFHSFWKPGHGPTNYTRYYDANEVYKVETYTQAYEPYVIFRKEGPPFCDERFIGYGANKAACLYEIYLSGVSFYVLPHDFLIHQSHEYAELTRKNERRYNRKLYLDFREELCFRYFNRFMEHGALDTPASQNLLTECKKVKGFAGTTSRLLAATVP